MESRKGRRSAQRAATGSKYKDDDATASLPTVCEQGKRHRETNNAKKAAREPSTRRSRHTVIDTRSDHSNFDLGDSYSRENNGVEYRDSPKDVDHSRGKSTRYTKKSTSRAHHDYEIDDPSGSGDLIVVAHAKESRMKTENGANREGRRGGGKKKINEKVLDVASVSTTAAHSQSSQTSSSGRNTGKYWSSLSVSVALAVMQADGSEAIAEKAANAVLEAGKNHHHRGASNNKSCLEDLATKVSIAVLEAGGDYEAAAAVAVAVMNSGDDNTDDGEYKKNSSTDSSSHCSLQQGKKSVDGIKGNYSDCAQSQKRNNEFHNVSYGSSEESISRSRRDIVEVNPSMENDDGQSKRYRGINDDEERYADTLSYRSKARSHQNNSSATSSSSSASTTTAKQRRHLKAKEDEITRKNRQLEETYSQKEKEMSKRMAETARLNLQKEIEISERLAALNAAEAALLEKTTTHARRAAEQLEETNTGTDFNTQVQQQKGKESSEKMTPEAPQGAAVEGDLSEWANNSDGREKEMSSGSSQPGEPSSNAASEGSPTAHKDNEHTTSEESVQQPPEGGHKNAFDELTGRLQSFLDFAWVIPPTAEAETTKPSTKLKDTEVMTFASYGTRSTRTQEAAKQRKKQNMPHIPEDTEESYVSYRTYSSRTPSHEKPNSTYSSLQAKKQPTPNTAKPNTSFASYSTYGSDSTSLVTNKTGDVSKNTRRSAIMSVLSDDQRTWHTAMSAITDDQRTFQTGVSALTDGTGTKSVRWNLMQTKNNANNHAATTHNHHILNQALYQAMNQKNQYPNNGAPAGHMMYHDLNQTQRRLSENHSGLIDLDEAMLEEIANQQRLLDGVSIKSGVNSHSKSSRQESSHGGVNNSHGKSSMQESSLVKQESPTKESSSAANNASKFHNKQSNLSKLRNGFFPFSRKKSTKQRR